MRTYECLFVSTFGDVATTTGSGNTRRTAERSARRKLPKSVGGLTWNLRRITPIAARHGARP